MKKTKFYLLVFVALILFGCSKTESELSSKIKGKVIDAGSGEGVRNAQIFLFDIESEGSFEISLIQTGDLIADSEGNFEIDRENAARFICAMKEPFYNSNCSNPQEISRSADEPILIKLFPWSNISVGIKDEDKLNLNVDYLELISPFEGDGSEQVYQFFPENNTVIPGNVIGGMERVLYYRIYYQDGTYVSRNMTIYPLAGSNPTFYLEY